MGFAVEEDPVCVFEDFLACVDNTRLYVIGRIEDFTGKVSSWCNYHESNKSTTCDVRVMYLWKTETQLKGPDSHLLR